MARIETLIEQVESGSDPGIVAAARELVRHLLALHGAGLARMLELAVQRAPGGEVTAAYTGDPTVRGLLLLHQLHPDDLETRVRAGLDHARPYLQSHGGNVELVEVDAEGGVRLRLHGSCHSCPSSSVTLEHAIEQAVREAAPEVTTITLDPAEPAATPALVRLAPAAGRANGR